MVLLFLQKVPFVVFSPQYCTNEWNEFLARDRIKVRPTGIDSVIDLALGGQLLLTARCVVG